MSSGGNGGNRLLLANAYAIYVTGNGRAAFDVLVPISYFLLLSPLLLMASGVSRFALPAIATFGLVTGIITSAAGVGSMNLELVAIAILGMTIGIHPLDRINAALHRPALLVLAYALYVAAITKWNVLFPLQVVGVCLSLLLIYFLGVKSAGDGIVPRRVIELGKYSLFAYIFHICVLQLLRRGLSDRDLSGVGLLVPFVATLVVTVIAVEVLGLARGRSNAVDRIYRIVFA